jgi:hypothetical protein
MYFVSVFLRDRSNAEGLLSGDSLANFVTNVKAGLDTWERIGYQYVPSPLDVARREDSLECLFRSSDVVQVRISTRPDRLKGYAPLK